MARRADLPTIEAESRPYWDAAAQRRLLIVGCRTCGERHHYPRPFCPECWSEDVEWIEASGRAELYTWSVVFVNGAPAFADRVPYIAAVVDLAEGPRVMTHLVDCEPEALAIGMALQVDFEPLDDEVLTPVFRPA